MIIPKAWRKVFWGIRGALSSVTGIWLLLICLGGLLTLGALSVLNIGVLLSLGGIGLGLLVSGVYELYSLTPKDIAQTAVNAQEPLGDEAEWVEVEGVKPPQKASNYAVPLKSGFHRQRDCAQTESAQRLDF